MNINSPHPEFERLADLATGSVLEPETRSARDHIAKCDACGLQFSKLERLIAIMRNDASQDAPAVAISGAFRAYDSYLAAQPADAEKASIIDRVVAVLRLDSQGLTPSFGTRSFGATSERQMIFHAGDIDFDIRIVPNESGKWTISGQIFNSPAEGELTLLGLSSDERINVSLTSQFQFSFPPVPSGRYKIDFNSATINVEIPDLQLDS